MKKRFRGNYKWIIKSRKRTSVIMAMQRPMIQTEIEEKVREKLGLSAKTNVILRGFVKRDILRCKNPERRKGRIYVMTDKGYKLAKRISKEKNIEWTYNEPGIDWNLYGQVACGKRGKKILLDIMEKRKAGIKEVAKDTTRSYKYKLLNDFVKAGLVDKSEENGMTVYVVSEKGEKITSIMLKD